jgi:ribosomal protein S9
LVEAKADLKQTLKDNRVLTAYIRTKEEKAWKQKEAEEARKLREAVEEAQKKQGASRKEEAS